MATSGVGRDCTFELDRFNEPRLCSVSETVKNIVMTVLYARPGMYPSLPNFGLDIQKMLYAYYNDIDEQSLETQLIQQCSELSTYFDNGSIVIKKMMYKNMPSLIIYVQTSYDDHYGTTARNQASNSLEFYIGLSVNETNELLSSIGEVYTGTA